MERALAAACVLLGAVLLWASHVAPEDKVTAASLRRLPDGTLVLVDGKVSRLVTLRRGCLVEVRVRDGTVPVYLTESAGRERVPAPGERFRALGRVESYEGRKEVRVDASGLRAAGVGGRSGGPDPAVRGVRW